jgi:hypothetical protein
MKKIKLNTGKFALVDDEDYDNLIKNKWQENKDKCTSYVKRSTTLYGKHGVSRSILMHRVIMGLEFGDGKEVDHVNHNGLDNRKCNLRIVTRSENVRHSKKIPKGYSWHIRMKKFIARIRINGVLHHLGYFSEEQDARNAYLKARSMLRRGHEKFINPLNIK